MVLCSSIFKLCVLKNIQFFISYLHGEPQCGCGIPLIGVLLSNSQADTDYIQEREPSTILLALLSPRTEFRQMMPQRCRAVSVLAAPLPAQCWKGKSKLPAPARAYKSSVFKCVLAYLRVLACRDTDRT